MSPTPASYFDTSTWDPRDVLSGGARKIPVTTPIGEFHVWTKRVGTNDDLNVLLLHGGPGVTDELYEPFDVWFPRAGIVYYYYDQLGSFRSDQPDDASLWDLPRFVDEVEQVRRALGLDSSNFVLLGQSWGGLLAMEYAVHHEQHLKGLVISNMMSSSRLYNDYAERVLMPAMDQHALAEIKRLKSEGATDDPRYEQLLMEHHYVHHVCRLPFDEWPGPGDPGAGSHQPVDLCPDARAERARHERHSRGLGPLRRPPRHRRWSGTTATPCSPAPIPNPARPASSTPQTTATPGRRDKPPSRAQRHERTFAVSRLRSCDPGMARQRGAEWKTAAMLRQLSTPLGQRRRWPLR